MLNFILLMGGGIGIFNMLGTQLGQMMCPTGSQKTLARVQFTIYEKIPTRDKTFKAWLACQWSR